MPDDQISEEARIKLEVLNSQFNGMQLILGEIKGAIKDGNSQNIEIIKSIALIQSDQQRNNQYQRECDADRVQHTMAINTLRENVKAIDDRRIPDTQAFENCLNRISNLEKSKDKISGIIIAVSVIATAVFGASQIVTVFWK